MKRIFVVGAGHIAGSHITAIKNIKSVGISGVCDIVRSSAEQLVRLHDLDAGVFTDAAEGIERVNPDYVVLLTPRYVRRPAVELCISAGLPVFMEKPPCHNMRTGRAILKALESARLVHGVAFMSRYNESLNRVLKKIKRERLSFINISYQSPMGSRPIFDTYPDPYLVERSGGLVGDQAIHCIDVCRYITGSEIKTIKALACNQTLRLTRHVTTCDAACWAMEMKDGTMVSHAHTWSASGWVCRIQLVTDKSDISVDMFKNTASGVFAGKDFHFAGDPVDPQAFELEHRAFLRAVTTGDMSHVRSPYADALKSFAAAEKINRQIYGDARA